MEQMMKKLKNGKAEGMDEIHMKYANGVVQE